MAAAPASLFSSWLLFATSPSARRVFFFRTLAPYVKKIWLVGSKSALDASLAISRAFASVAGTLMTLFRVSRQFSGHVGRMGGFYLQVLCLFVADVLILAVGFNSGVLVVVVGFNHSVLLMAIAFNSDWLILAVGFNSRLLGDGVFLVCLCIVASELAAALVQLLRALVLATHFECDLWCACAKIVVVLTGCGDRERVVV